jgi:DNA-binding CsgD family transcriptional regulator
LTDPSLRSAIHTALRQSASPLVAFDLESLLVLGANQAACDYLGPSPGAFDGVDLCDVLEPRHVVGARAARELLVSGDIDSFGATRYVRQPDGRMTEVHIWVRVVAAPGEGFGLVTIEDERGHSRRFIHGSPLTTAELQELEVATGLVSHLTEADLSPRQQEILALLVRGDTVREIAAAMYLSTSTVRNHLSVIYKKFGVHTQAGLLAKVLGGLSRQPLRRADGRASHGDRVRSVS